MLATRTRRGFGGRRGQNARHEIAPRRRSCLWPPEVDALNA
jgi:hypothetical protein